MTMNVGPLRKPKYTAGRTAAMPNNRRGREFAPPKNHNTAPSGKPGNGNRSETREIAFGGFHNKIHQARTVPASGPTKINAARTTTLKLEKGGAHVSGANYPTFVQQRRLSCLVAPQMVYPFPGKANRGDGN